MIATASMVVTGVSGFLVAVNHKRIRSNCCGRKAEVSFDMTDTRVQMPATPALQIMNPTPV